MTRRAVWRMQEDIGYLIQYSEMLVKLEPMSGAGLKLAGLGVSRWLVVRV